VKAEEGKRRVKNHLEDRGVDERIQFKYTLMKWCVKVKTGFSWLKTVSTVRILLMNMHDRQEIP
jgi:hypothetical protein